MMPRVSLRWTVHRQARPYVTQRFKTFHKREQAHLFFASRLEERTFVHIGARGKALLLPPPSDIEVYDSPPHGVSQIQFRGGQT